MTSYFYGGPCPTYRGRFVMFSRLQGRISIITTPHYDWQAIHSIAYGVPVSSLFLFGVYDPTHGGFFW